MIRALLIAALFPAMASAEQYNFCWVGSGGYTMTGVIAFPDALNSQAVITEEEVTRFEITGYENLVPVGHWNLGDMKRDATWHLRFLTRELRFPTGGSFPGPDSQGWNANGDVTDCGEKGFGFNSGNYAQDVCLFGTWVRTSSIPPDTPFYVTKGPVTPDCRNAEFTS